MKWSNANMPLNRGTQAISLYVPEKARQQKVIERLAKLGRWEAADIRP